jgi:threonine dehydrogenase-like Zn-dependent dehydrogenase
MRAPHMGGDFPFPVKYGYSVVGVVESGDADVIGRTVFVLHPHQTRFNVPADSAIILPERLPPRRAVMAANMETALNAVWDGAPRPADRIAIVGSGVVGALVAFLCERLPGAEVTLVDTNPARAETASRLGVEFASAETAPRDCDLVFHASGTGAGLATALTVAGQEAAIIDLSWYGDSPIELSLGGVFHSRRLRLISSQVGQVAASRRSRWTRRRRLAAAVNLLLDDRLDALIEAPIAFRHLPHRMQDLLRPDSGVLCQLIAYS